MSAGNNLCFPKCVERMKKVKRKIANIMWIITVASFLGMTTMPMNCLGGVNVSAFSNLSEITFEGEDFVVGEEPAIRKFSAFNGADAAIIKSDATEGIGKHLSIATSDGAANLGLEISNTMDLAADDAVIIYEFDFKATRGNDLTIARLYSGEYAYQMPLISTDSYGNIVLGTTSTGTPLDLDEWNHFKVLFYTETRECELFYKGTFLEDATYTVPATPFVPTKLFLNMASANNTTSEYGIDNIKMYAPDQFEVLSSTPENNSDNISCKTDIKVKFTNQIDEDSLDDVVVTLNGNLVGGATASVDVNDDTVCVINLNTQLTKSTDYTVNIAGVKDIYRQEMESTDITFKTKDSYLEVVSLNYYKDGTGGTDITETGLVAGEITAEIGFVNASEDTYNVTAIMGLFDKADGSLENIAYNTATIAETVNINVPQKVTATFDVTGNAADYYIKIFVWNGFDKMSSFAESDKFVADLQQTEDDSDSDETTNYASDIRAEVSYDDKLATVIGTLSDEEKGIATLLVLRPNTSVGEITTDTVDEIVEYIGQCQSNENGDYTFAYGLNETYLSAYEGQAYQVILGGNNILPANQKETSYKYYGVDSRNAVCAAMLQKTGDEIGQLLLEVNPELIGGTIELNDVLKMDLTDYRNLEIKSPVHNALAGKTFSSVDDIKTAFEEAVEIQKVIDVVRNSSTGEMTDVLTANNQVLGLDLTNEYGYKSLLDKKAEGDSVASAAIDAVHNAVKQEYELGKLQDVFHKNVVIQAVNAATRDDVEQILENNNGDLLLDLTGDVTRLTFDDRTLLNQKLVEDYNFTSYQDIREAFTQELNGLLAGYPDPDEDTDPDYGTDTGSDSGGGGRVSSITVKEKKPQPEQKNDFIDISDVPWAQESIRALQKMGCIEGVGNNRFAPNNVLTREQFVKMLVLAFDLYDETAEVKFNDVIGSAWYYRYVASAYQLGIVNGIGDGSFGVNKTVTRQEMAAMLHRVALLKKVSIPAVTEPQSFADEADIDAYALDSIKTLQSGGIISGVGEQRFSPREATTRAMAAKVIYSIIKLEL